MHYVAYGLRLSCSFPLPGMESVGRACGEGLPMLTIAEEQPSDLQSAWSGTDAPPEWCGRLGDGRDLTIERGRAGDLLFTYGELAYFRLHEDMRHLDCAPRGQSLDWQRALIGKVLSSISVMLGYEALHAAVVDTPRGIVAIMAPSGTGKSTLAIELLRRGLPLFADDVLMLDQTNNAVRAHPGTPHMNLAENTLIGVQAEALGTTLGSLEGERWLSVRATSQQPRPVRMLCLLARGPGLALAAETLPGNPLLLAPYMLGLSTDVERQRRRFDLYANLIESATLVRLTGGLEHPPEQLADLIEQALLRQPQPSVGLTQ